MEVKVVFLIIGVFLAIVVLCDDPDDDFPERKYMNTSVDPCDDFYEYTCGNFKNVYPLDNDTPTIDHFTLLEDELTKIINNILLEDDFIDDPQALNKSKSAYKACVDTNYLNKVINPEITIVDAENGFPLVQPQNLRDTTTYDFNDIGNAVSKYGIPMLFTLMSFPSYNDPTKNLIYISGIDTDTLTPSEIRPFHEDTAEQIIEKGFLELSQKYNVKSNRNLETVALPFDILLRRIALKIRTAVQSPLTDSQVIQNLEEVNAFTRGVFTQGSTGNMTDFPNMSVTVKELNIWTKEKFTNSVLLDWLDLLQNIFNPAGIQITEETEVMNYNGLTNFLYGIINLVRSTEEHVVKSYVMMRVFVHLAVEGDANSRQYIDDYFNGMNRTILPRWKYCTRKIIDSIGTAGLSFAAAYEFQLRHFNVNNFNSTVELITDIQSAFKEIMQNSTWMDDESKSIALQKFENMVTILGHPDISYDREDLDRFYENIRICKWDNYGNSIRIKAFKNAYQISQLPKRDRAFWDKSPFETNAYYNKPNNKITFPIAMLNPIFSGNKNRILDYARIGSIIGHEITHGFDKDGMRYGPDGTMESWATNSTKMAFFNKSTCFVEEYNQFNVPEINTTVDGNKTLNENIADNGGVREAFLAMKKMVQKKGIVRDGKEFTNEQLFFIGYGTLWCNNPSIDYLYKMKENEHARSKFRVNGVISNMEEFSEAFNCRPGSNMNPLKKCQLW